MTLMTLNNKNPAVGIKTTRSLRGHTSQDKKAKKQAYFSSHSAAKPNYTRLYNDTVPLSYK